MGTAIGIIALIVFVIWLIVRDKRTPEEKRREQLDRERWQQFSFEYPQLQRIINESLEIINNTKNVETAVGRFDTIKQQLNRLLEIAPDGANLSMGIQGQRIKTMADLNQVDFAKREWIRSFYKNKAEIELKKVALLSSPKLRTTQLKKAINIVLKGIEYLPNDAILQGLIYTIEGKLNAVESEAGNKKEAVKEWTVMFRRAIKDGVLTDDELKELREHEQRMELREEDTKSYWDKAEKIGINISIKED
jgi:tetratricopeptide (TPR) repeat protein